MANYSNLTFNSDYLSKSLTLDGISFNHVIHTDTHHTQILGRGTWGTTNTSGTLIDDNYAVNAVDINWNGAQPGLGESSTGITTTGELLKLIKKYADTKKSEAIDYVQGTDDDTSSDDTIWGTKKYADEAVSTVKGELIGTSTDASTADTIWGAKKYTDTKIAKLQNRVDALESALSTLAQNVGSLVTIANG